MSRVESPGDQGSTAGEGALLGAMSAMALSPEGPSSESEFFLAMYCFPFLGRLMSPSGPAAVHDIVLVGARAGFFRRQEQGDPGHFVRHEVPFQTLPGHQLAFAFRS